MTCSNSVNLEQLDGGTVIKQGDVSSRFEYRLLDENNEVIPLAGREAKISIGKSGYLYFETRTTVSETNTVSFTITSVLPVGTHRVEVSCLGYVFPSDKSTTITVKKSHEEYAVAGALDKVYYDDTELREGLSEVSSKVAEQADDIASVKTSVGDIQEEYDSRLRTLEAKEDFDDSALKAKDSEQDGRLSTLEEATAQVPELRSNLTSEKEARLEALAAVDSRLQVLEAKPDFDDSELKAKDVEQDGRLQSLEDKTASLDSLRDGLSQNKSDLAEFKAAQSATNSELDSRLDVLETKEDFDDSALKAKDLEQDGRLQVLEGQTDETKQGLTAIQRTVSDFKGTQETVQSAFNSRLQRLEEKPDFDDSKLKAKDVEQDGRLSGLEGKTRTLELASSTQNETLTELDSRLSANTQRLQALETKPDFDPSPLKAKDSEQDERLSALEGETAQISELQSSVSAEKQERKEALEGVAHRLQTLEAKPDFDSSNLEAKDRELEEQLSRLHNYDDSELRQKAEQQEQTLLNMTQALGKGIVEVAIVNKLIYDMPGFEFYNTDASVKALASYLHDNRLDYSIANMREMSRVNHQELVANLSSASRGQGQKLTLTYQPKRLPDNFRLLAYTDQYRYDAVRSANYGGIGANNSHLAIFYIGTDPVFYVMHPKDKQVSLMTDYNDYSFGMVKSIKLQTKMDYNQRFSITKLMFRTDTSLQNRMVEYKAVLQLID